MSFILPSSGRFDILELLVTLVAALIGLLERGPLLVSLILSKSYLFYSVKPLLLLIAQDFRFKSSGLSDPYLCKPLAGLAL